MSEPLRLLVKRLRPGAVLPTQAHPGDAGWDLYAAEDGHLRPGAITFVATGVAVAVPPGHVGLVRDRSGLAGRNVSTRAGVIDSVYRGELQVALAYEGEGYFYFRAGDRIAQLLILPAPPAVVVEVDDLGATQRGERGFGSSGG